MAGAGGTRDERRRRRSHTPDTGSTRPPDLTQQVEELIAALSVDRPSTALSVEDRLVLMTLIETLAALLDEDAIVDTQN